MAPKVFKFPLILVATFGGLMVMLNIAGIHYPHAISNSQLIAGLTFGLGISLLLFAAISFRKVNTTVNPVTPEAATHLVTTGIFSLSRNPMYVGFLLLLAAVAVYLHNIINFIFLPIFVWLANRWYIRPEESALQTIFKEGYSDYKRKVRRWI